MSFRVAVAAAGLAALLAARGTGGAAPSAPSARRRGPRAITHLSEPNYLALRAHLSRYAGWAMTHDRLLRTLAELYRPPLTGCAATASLITGSWK
ncbi:MAG: hypothetical protein ACLPKI_16210 [Streptosporangiaceae bacterium]